MNELNTIQNQSQINENCSGGLKALELIDRIKVILSELAVLSADVSIGIFFNDYIDYKSSSGKVITLTCTLGRRGLYRFKLTLNEQNIIKSVLYKHFHYDSFGIAVIPISKDSGENLDEKDYTVLRWLIGELVDYDDVCGMIEKEL